ncbi:Na-Ca exchanger/integrin-beta4 [Trichodesmium erythraeum IMS101]|uniref:Na-Ca exchanger/integrin-beta4 n=1 Tax=Trichodesmium erythraeum (strain IMS101) TaxID=203124 RepID=Q10XQ7_TRIEI|nr:VCBS repeat-containing protein [Trichodesmium erythraeum GBRTRLIN201]
MTDDSEFLDIMSDLELKHINNIPPITFLGQVSVEVLPAVEIIEEGLAQFQENLTNFAASETFEADMLNVFGESGKVDLGKTIVDTLAKGENLPQINIVPVELMNGAAGGFDSLTGMVYLTDSLINENSVIGSETRQFPHLTDVLAEELGHYIDSKLNTIDTPGDEGEWFAALVRGDVLSVEEVEGLRGEDDMVKILNGLVEVEASSELSFKISNFPTGDQPFGMAVADFDKDGFKDIVAANVGSTTVSVLFGDGKGGALTATTHEVGGKPVYAAVGDFNRDRNPDIATTNQDDDTVAVLLGDGKGRFSSPSEFPVGDGPSQLAVADVNQDRKLDIVTGNSGSDNVSVLLGSGNGSFAESISYQVGADLPANLVVKDFNGDGKLDIVTANGNSNNVSVLLGNRDGGFDFLTSFIAGGDTPSGIVAKDVNGDKKQDIVINMEDSDKVSVLFGLGDGRFGFPNSFPVGNSPEDIAIGDLNGDRKLDIVTVNRESNNISILPGQGKGSFGSAINFQVGDAPEDVVVEDFNADGKLDIATTNGASDTISILLNTTKMAIFPNIAISDTKITEGDKGRKNAKFTVTLDNESDQTVKVNYATANKTAKGNEDYKPTKGTLTFKPGETQKNITVPILGDNKVEPNETFNLNLSKPKNARLKDKVGLGTITNDDKKNPPQISISDTKIVEGNRGRKNAKFTVTLDAKPIETVQVDYGTRNQTAKANQDYKPTKGTLTFRPGQTRKTITVPIFGDNKIENDETFQLNLSKPRNAQLKDRRGIGTIRNNDLPKLFIKDREITEGDDGKKQLTFDVTLNAKTQKRVEVSYATADGTAKEGSDYQKTQGKLIFQPNQKKKTVTVPILGDLSEESSENFTVNLRKPKNARLGDKGAIGTIKDNDRGGEQPGESFQTAINLGQFTGEVVRTDEVGFSRGIYRNTNDFYTFQTDKESAFVLFLDNLLQDANIGLYGSEEEVINQSKNSGIERESIVTTLDPGTYYVRVYPQGASRTDYRLSLNLL